MSATKKSVDEIWKELNAAKPKPRQGVAGLAVGLSGLPGITSIVRTKPATGPPTAAPLATEAAGPAPSPGLADSPYQASAVGEDASAYLATLQRTINCLADPDRGLRRTAATSLHTKLFTGDASTPRASPAQLQSLLCGPLLRPLVAMLSDSVERCRSVALSVLLDGGRQLTDVGPLLPELVPELARRFGALPVQEPAEEVRLQIAQLLALLLEAAPSPLLSHYTADLAAVICRSLEDGFPDIKKVACGAVETAAARLPAGCLEPEAEKLLASLAPNLQHQHSRVRLAAIQALDALVAAGAPMALVEGRVVDALRPVGHDRAQAVREAAFAALARWMGCRGGDAAVGAAPTAVAVGGGCVGKDLQGKVDVTASDGAGGATGGDSTGAASSTAVSAPVRRGSRAYVPSLLPLLIIGVTDPQPATADLALRLVEGVGEAWAQEGDGGGSGRSSGSALQLPQGAAEFKPGEAEGGQAEGAPSSPAPSSPPSTPPSAAAAGSAIPVDEGGNGVTSATQQERATDVADAGGADAGANAGAASPAAAGPSSGPEADEVAARLAACRLGPPYHGRPGPGCRAMVRALLPQHLPPLVRQLGEWTVALRVAAARGLHTTLVMAEDAAAAHLRLLLPALCSAIADEEVQVASQVMSCVHVMGAHVDPEEWMPRLLDALSSPSAAPSGTSSPSHVVPAPTAAAAPAAGGGLSVSQRTHTLVVLSGMLHAAGRARRQLPPPLLRRLATVLAEEAMLAAAAEHLGVRQQLLGAVINLLAWGGPACADVALPLHIVLLQLYGSELAAVVPTSVTPGPQSAAADGGRAAAVRNAMATLAVCCGVVAGSADEDAGAATLTERHADWLTAALFGKQPAAAGPAAATTGPALAWRCRPGDPIWQCVLRATLLTASPATLDRMAPPLVSALGPIVGDKEREASLRLALLQLLDGVLEDPRRGPILARAGGQALITDVLMPPLVWQAGKTAAAVRYGAITALATLLSKRLPDPAHVTAAVEGAATGAAAAGASGGATAQPAAGARRGGAGVVGEGSGLLPLLFSSLDEDWYTDLRLAACFVVEKLLELVGSAMSDASRRALYPELHKRLDDAHNSVRVAACGALRALVAAAGPAYCDTNSGYLVAGVVIHMDDGDPAVQEAACGVLLAAAAVKPTVTAAEVRKVRDRFRSKHYCDRVLAACEAAAAGVAEAPEAASV